MSCQTCNKNIDLINNQKYCKECSYENTKFIKRRWAQHNRDGTLDEIRPTINCEICNVELIGVKGRKYCTECKKTIDNERKQEKRRMMRQLS